MLEDGKQSHFKAQSYIAGPPEDRRGIVTVEEGPISAEEGPMRARIRVPLAEEYAEDGIVAALARSRHWRVSPPYAGLSSAAAIEAVWTTGRLGREDSDAALRRVEGLAGIFD